MNVHSSLLQLLYGIIKYVNFEYDIDNNIMPIFVVYKLYKANKVHKCS